MLVFETLPLFFALTDLLDKDRSHESSKKCSILLSVNDKHTLDSLSGLTSVFLRCLFKIRSDLKT